MDKRVLVAFIAFIILLGGIIGMRYLLDPKCEVPVILLSSEKLEIKESISIKTENGRNVQWIINKDTIENKASSVTKKILDNKVVQEGVKEIQKTENQKAMGEKFENLLENSTKTLEKIDVNLDNKK